VPILLGGDPSLLAWLQASRTQVTTASAMLQRKVAAGVNVTGLVSGIKIFSSRKSRTTFGASHSPGPVIGGSAGAIARFGVRPRRRSAAEPVLFGRVIDALGANTDVDAAWQRLSLLPSLWPGFGLFNIVCTTLVAPRRLANFLMGAMFPAPSKTCRPSRDVSRNKLGSESMIVVFGRPHPERWEAAILPIFVTATDLFGGYAFTIALSRRMFDVTATAAPTPS
jgi:hypothetical protein